MANSMSSDDRPAYVNFYTSDWLGGCATLPPLAEWAYLQISLYCMDKGEAVPPARLPMIFVRLPDYEAQVELLIEAGKVHKTQGGGLFVKRALAEYRKSENALLKKKRAGKAGAKKRWENSEQDSSANGNATKNRCDTISNQNQEPEPDDAKASPPIIPQNEQGDFLSIIPDDAWEKFEQHRAEIGKPLTKVARKRAKLLLDRLHREHGMDPAAVIQQTLDHVWVGLHPLKGGAGGKSGWDFIRGEA